MARKRTKSAGLNLPTRVYPGKSQYEYHPACGGSISLCPLDAPLSLVWARYEAACRGIQEKGNLAGLIADFFDSADFCRLGKETKNDYRKYSKKIISVFGKMDPDAVKPQHIRKYMDKRGVTAPTQANREKTFMSRVFGWAYERGIVKMNPCKGVRQFKEEARERYITDREYDALYVVAPPLIQAAMEVAYLCCARQGDILALTKAQILPEGIFIRQGKTGKKQIKAWTERLRAAIELAESLPLKDGMISMFVLHQQRGHRYTRDGFNSRWQKAKDKAAEQFPDISFDFTFHDLKAKGISDLEGSLMEKQAISGHKTITQTARYDRKTQIVPVVGGQ
ncbi:tyrosine-type recombinase/integrase [Serratia rhizosphaerae]|uniref:Tyrosine-type recombinase/integrase n=1 Tax=Serratia rhizosphaerae TaxID=2597702 RepID=A0ABX6GHI6_9GAMM|nr:tyrosine-type recombinase/integrase [Serratia rhizosphaerae]QHA85735.1 tyrosine-type recombinase/integrase [Serratia rhizosphaerae]